MCRMPADQSVLCCAGGFGAAAGRGMSPGGFQAASSSPGGGFGRGLGIRAAKPVFGSAAGQSRGQPPAEGTILCLQKLKYISLSYFMYSLIILLPLMASLAAELLRQRLVCSIEP